MLVCKTAMQNNQIVSLSGGKDSTAMLLMMLERGESVHSVVFFDTGWEFPQMYDHIDKIERFRGYDTVCDLEARFSQEYRLLELPISIPRTYAFTSANYIYASL